MKKTLFSLLMAIAAPLLSGAQTYTYTPKADLISPHHAFNSVTVNGKVYIFGGSNLTSIQDIVQEYDVATNTWATKQPLPKSITEAFAGAVNGKIYVVGGWDGNMGVNYVQEYDPVTDTWAQKATMPTGRGIISGAVIGNKIYITCGYPGHYSALEVYEPATNTWATKTNAQYGIIQDNGGASLGSNMYIIGGADDARTLFYDYNMQYNSLTDTWVLKAPLPEKLFAGCAVAFQGKVHYFGGYKTFTAADVTDAHYIYDESTNTWSTGPALPKKLAHLAGAVVGNKLYIGGGVDASGVLVDDFWEYSAVADPAGIAANAITPVAMTAFPNPAVDIVNIQVANMGSNARISLCDAAGTIIKTIAVSNAITTIDMQALPVGVYIVRYNDNSQVGFLTLQKK